VRNAAKTASLLSKALKLGCPSGRYVPVTEEIVMTFAESIRVCFAKYADFKGCASLSEFWWWVLFTFLAGAAIGVISDRASAVFSIATFLPSIAVGARRLHDTDRSGWFQLLWLIPLVGWIILIVLLVQDSKAPNRYCSDATEVSI
jgi:uncharacterized membrane protein YhaH (DUF805 family)